MIIYDFEVFKYDWLVHLINTETQSERTITNNPTELFHYYQEFKHTVWIGYNSNSYDRYILQGILADFDPYDLSIFIIDSDHQGWEYSEKLNNYPLYSYDTKVGTHSLKTLQGFMGHSIKESAVPFDINRPLTEYELYEVQTYCINDVHETFNVFLQTIDYFNAKLSLINKFKLPLKHINKTMARLSAELLSARLANKNDEYDIYTPDNAEVNNAEVMTFFDRKRVMDEDLVINLADVEHKLGRGGIHGAKPNYLYEADDNEHIILMDVTQQYPSIMLQYDLLSRGVRFKSRYKLAYEESLRLRGTDRRLPYKEFLNSTYGASGAKFNKLFDPRNRLLTCVYAQCFIVDLIEKIEPYVELIQTNTDGVLVKVANDNFDKLDEIVFDWEERTGLRMDFEYFDRVYQKDVNNYILVGDKLRTAGIVKDLSPLDNDLPIINRAIREYFINDIPVERTIATGKLIDFQKIVRVSYKFDGAKYGNVIRPEKTFRVYANKSGQSLVYLKNNKTSKIPNTPDAVTIVNHDVRGLEIPDWLDLDWYIELANKRVKEFMGSETVPEDINVTQESLW